MTKHLLIIAATHGDEKIGLEIIAKLRTKGLDQYFDWIIGNPLALKRKTRFVEKDLNRSYPGKRNSKIYEERRSYENFKAAKKYRYVIDIHEASAGMDDFIIVPRKKLSNKFPVQNINLGNILLWPDPTGPLAQYLEQAIELEFGMKDRERKQAANKGVMIVEGFINTVINKNLLTRRQNVYSVYGKIRYADFKIKKELKDFKLCSLNGEKFFPLLVGQYVQEGIMCYKMKKHSNL